MSGKPKIKPLYWVGSSKRDLLDCPEEVQNTFGYALHVAQIGGKHEKAKPLKGFGGAGVLEVIADDDGSTFRAVYTVKIADAIYVLHVFQKKSTRGIETSQRDMEMVRSRLRAVLEAGKANKLQGR